MARVGAAAPQKTNQTKLTVIVRRRVHTFPLFLYNINFMHRRFTEDAALNEVSYALHKVIKYYKGYIMYYVPSIHDIHQRRCNNYN
jgi:hypothetical protein